MEWEVIAVLLAVATAVGGVAWLLLNYLRKSRIQTHEWRMNRDDDDRADDDVVSAEAKTAKSLLVVLFCLFFLMSGVQVVIALETVFLKYAEELESKGFQNARLWVYPFLVLAVVLNAIVLILSLYCSKKNNWLSRFWG